MRAPSSCVPQFSLPTLQYFTLYGSVWPFAMRIRPHLPTLRLQYSIQSLISSGVPVPALVQIYGSQPTLRHHLMYSSVPNVFGSSTCHVLSYAGTRSLPTPPTQW